MLSVISWIILYAILYWCLILIPNEYRKFKSQKMMHNFCFVPGLPTWGLLRNFLTSWSHSSVILAKRRGGKVLLFNSTMIALVGYLSGNWSNTTTLLNFVLLKNTKRRVTPSTTVELLIYRTWLAFRGFHMMPPKFKLSNYWFFCVSTFMRYYST